MRSTALPVVVSALAFIACEPSVPTPPRDAGSLDARLARDAGSRSAVCGDRILTAPEECDEGDDNGGDTCAWDCTNAAPFLAYDRVIRELMDRYEIPGGAVGVAVQGRLVLVRGYGVMDLEGRAMDPLARFRIASISKPITAVSIVQLVEEGELSFDDRVFVDHLAHLLPAEGTAERDAMDPRLLDITVRHLLHHSGGWDRDVEGGYDPMFIPSRVATALEIPSPPEASDIARYMVEQELDFTPGERYAYSNFGYALLGRVIESVTGEDYETYVRSHLLEPIGAGSMQIGQTRLDRVADDESYYFPAMTGQQAPTVFESDGHPQAPLTYGAWYQQALDAHGGWIARSVDLLRFSLAVDGFSSRRDILADASIAAMTERPTALFPTADSPTYFYAMGWSVRVLSDGRHNRWHGGSLPGTSTILVRNADDVSWVALFNRRPTDASWRGAMDAAMWEAYRSVSTWPEHDLFERIR